MSDLPDNVAGVNPPSPPSIIDVVQGRTPAEPAEIPISEGIAGMFEQGVPEPDQVLSPEEVQQREELILQLSKRKHLFHYIEAVQSAIPDTKRLRKMSIDELNSIIHAVDFNIKVYGSGSFVKSGIGMALNAAETIGPMVGFQIQGLSGVVMNEKNLHTQHVLNELALKYESFAAVEPEIKFAYIILQTSIGLHYYNAAMQESEKRKENAAAVPSDFKEKYSGLD